MLIFGLSSVSGREEFILLSFYFRDESLSSVLLGREDFSITC